jgi:hypothetical protein
METAGRLLLADVFVSIEDPRQSAKVKRDLVELLVVAVNAVLVGADTFAEIELWAEEKLEWLRGYAPPVASCPCLIQNATDVSQSLSKMCVFVSF